MFERPHLKITRRKWTGCLTQVVGYLLSKNKALSSIPKFQSHSTKRKNRKEKEKSERIKGELEDGHP
jgi:hypothetical protein